MRDAIPPSSLGYPPTLLSEGITHVGFTRIKGRSGSARGKEAFCLSHARCLSLPLFLCVSLSRVRARSLCFLISGVPRTPPRSLPSSLSLGHKLSLSLSDPREGRKEKKKKRGHVRKRQTQREKENERDVLQSEQKAETEIETETETEREYERGGGARERETEIETETETETETDVLLPLKIALKSSKTSVSTPKKTREMLMFKMGSWVNPICIIHICR